MEYANCQAVLVTGASSGIGKACALLLDRQGFTVFAGVRKHDDGNELQHQASPKLRPILLDVTDPTAIENAARIVRCQLAQTGLAGLVNNAGFGDPGPIEYVPLADVKRQFEVNVFGAIAVTQAFLPLIRQGGGRIVNIGSVGDRITMPFGGVLCSSKCAVASLTDALRLELRPWGIRVCLIEPALIATPGVEKTSSGGKKLLEEFPPEGASRYGKMFQTFLDRAMRREREGSSPDVVAAAVLEALTATTPKTRYPIGKNARVLTSLARLPDRLLDRLRLRMFNLPTGFGALAPRH
jgi:NAD(P)-dependent dehydrogenase (short-subunit alcohol dehydrogenase family)